MDVTPEVTRMARMRWDLNVPRTDHDRVEREITYLRDRMLAHKRCPLTHDDMLEMLVKPEHRQLSRDAVQVLDTRPTNMVEMKMPDPTHPDGEVTVNLYIRTHFGRGMLIPAYAMHQSWNWQEGEGWDKLRKWLTWRMQHEREWCLVQSVYGWLNQKYNIPSLEHVRFFWPAIMGLLSEAGCQATLAKLQKFKAPKDIPSIPLTLRQALQDTQVTVTKALVTPVIKHEDRKRQEVDVTIDTNYNPGRTPWGTDMIKP